MITSGPDPGAPPRLFLFIFNMACRKVFVHVSFCVLFGDGRPFLTDSAGFSVITVTRGMGSKKGLLLKSAVYILVKIFIIEEVLMKMLKRS